MISTRVEGVNDVIRRMKLAGVDIGKHLERGLMKAGLHLQRESQKIVPVDTGKLKNSAFTRRTGEKLDTVVVVGYTAHYAIYVHENPTARHKPGKRYKFLEEPARSERDRMRQIIITELNKARG